MSNDFDRRSDSHAGGCALPAWPQSRRWDYFPTGGLSLIPAILPVILLLLDWF